MKDYSEQLREAIRDRSAVIIYGAGVSKAITGGAPSADWIGLVRTGIDHAVELGAPEGWADQTRGLIESALNLGELNMLVTAAGLVQKKLREFGRQSYADWLKESIGDLECADRSLANALGSLGVPLLTTNYDTLVEQILGRSSTTWTEAESMRRVLKSESDAIGHVHGVWDIPQTVVLSEGDYTSLLSQDTAQFLQRSYYATKSFIFVGYGEGLNDPNFGNMLELHRKLFPESQQNHFRLCLKSDESNLRAFHADSDIRVVSYGVEHSDLPAFLNQLRPHGGTARTHDYVAFAAEALLDQIRSETVVGSHLSDVAQRELHEITVSPVLLPLPHEQFVAQHHAKDNDGLDREDPFDVSKRQSLVLVAGEELSGITTTLRWLATTAATEMRRSAPLYVDGRKCTSNQYALGKQVREEALAQRVIDKRNETLPRHVLALDNLRHSDSRPFQSIIQELKESQAEAIFVGVRLGEEAMIAEALSGARHPIETVYVGKMGRTEIEAFAQVLLPVAPPGIAGEVLTIIRREHLPRTPLTVSLLLVLFAQGAHNSAKSSETNVLDKYLQLLLNRNESYMDPRWTLDSDNYEVALAHLAKVMVRSRKGALKIGRAIDNIDDHFQSVDWPDDALTSLQSFQSMRILRIQDGLVQFQLSSYLHLFAAKAAIEDADFLQELLLDPLFFSPIIRHYAALVRSSETVASRLYKILKDDWTIHPPSSEVYQLVNQRSIDVLEIVKQSEDHDSEEGAEPSPSILDEDFYLGDDSDRVAFPLDDPSTWNRTQRLTGILDLASRVVRDSDRLPDLELKSELFIAALERWGYLLDHFVSEGTFTESLRQVIDAAGEAESWSDAERDARITDLSLKVPAFVVFAGLTSTLTSRKLSRAYNRAVSSGRLEQNEYVACMSALFVFDLGDTGWPQAFERAFNKFGHIWFIADLLFAFARLAILNQQLTPSDGEALVKFSRNIAARTVSFSSDAEMKRQLGELEQRWRRDLKRHKGQRVQGGAGLMEALEDNAVGEEPS